MMKMTNTMMEVAKELAPEDVAVGDYITVTRLMFEWPILTTGFKPEVEAVRATLLHPCAGQPYRVVKVCLPFVLVCDPNRKHQTLDLRTRRVARLTQSYGRAAFRRLSDGDATKKPDRKKRK